MSFPAGALAPKCARCDKSVYQAEEVLGPAGRKYHKFCLTCISCNKRLASLHLLEHKGDPYCKQCHSSNFGPKGYGFGGAVTGEYARRQKSPVLQAPSPQPTRSFSRPSLATSNTSWANDQRGGELGNDAPQQNEVSDTLSPLAAAMVGNKLYEPSNRSPSPTRSAASSTASAPSPTRFSGLGGAPDTCRRCGKPVYFAEQMLAAGQKWHKICLRCAGCDAPVSSHLNVNEHLPYCNRCYEKNFGQGFLK